MFINLFRALRRHGVPVTFNEWLVLQRALSENRADSSLVRFYYLARSILVKSEAHFDKYDQAFLECFRQIESTEELVRDLRTMSPLPDGTTLGVAGSASGNIDISEKLAQALPVYLAVVGW